jgi:tRNA dimethylallyltransferase
VAFIGLDCKDRALLYDRINRRVDIMVENGLLEEARQVLSMEQKPTAYQAIGYKELESYFTGEQSLDEALERLKQSSRRYAKRQLTWFRRERDVIWLNKQDYGYDESKLLEVMLEHIQERTEIKC